jgi:hypothetical protein
LIKDYDVGIIYYPGKANIVVDALSHKKYCNATFARKMRWKLCQEIRYLNLAMVNETAIAVEVEPTLDADIKKAQMEDEKIKEIWQLVKENKTNEFTEDGNGTLWLGKRLCVHSPKPFRELILWEAHDSAYSIHPGRTKMYKDLKARYWWYDMNRDIEEYVSLCDTCQWVKAEHQRSVGLLHPLKIPEWKWEEIRMDIIVGLPSTQVGYNSIWVIMDRLMKVAHFILVRTTYSRAKLAELYMSQIICLLGVPKKIVSDKGS